MKTFTDNAGRTWTVAINVTTLKQMKSLVGVDLLDVVNDNGTLLERLAGDPVLLCDVIFALCKEEADAKNVTDADFGRAMAGDAIEAATTALLEELVDFFRGEKRATLRRALKLMRRYEEKALKAAQMKLDDPRLEAAVDNAVARMTARMDERIAELAAQDSTPGDSSGSAPASQALTPAP